MLTGPYDNAFSVFAAMGDLNGDGFADIAVPGALPFEDEPAVPSAYIYLGSPSGPAGTPIAVNTLSGAGHALGIPGDVNGDGFADLVVGGNAAAYVFGGTTSGVAPVPETMTSPSALDKYLGAAGVD